MTTLKTMGTCLDSRCEATLISSSTWERADQDQRSDWALAGYRKYGSHGFCARHGRPTNEEFVTARDAKYARDGGLRGHAGRMVAQEANERAKMRAARDRRYVAGKYHGLVRQGFRDPIGEISHQTGRRIDAIYKSLYLAGVKCPRRDPRVLRRMEIIEEVTFFRSLGRGVKEICDKLDITPEKLAENLRHWKTDGYHDLDLDWLDGHLTMEYRNAYGSPKWK